RVSVAGRAARFASHVDTHGAMTMTPPTMTWAPDAGVPPSRRRGRSRLAGMTLAMILVAPASVAAPALAAAPGAHPSLATAPIVTAAPHAVAPTATRTESTVRARVSTTEIRPNEAVFFRGRVYSGAARTPVG